MAPEHVCASATRSVSSYSRSRGVAGVDVTTSLPGVTIVIPVKDGSAWLSRALSSTREQGVAFELIVVDDGSVDDSAAIARAWPGARVLTAIGRGAPGARNS